MALDCLENPVYIVNLLGELTDSLDATLSGAGDKSAARASL
jgi:hypothetical protein